MISPNRVFVFSIEIAVVIYGYGAQNATFRETRPQPGIAPGNFQNPTSI